MPAHVMSTDGVHTNVLGYVAEPPRQPINFCERGLTAG
jgi:hypothetical protein